MGKARIEIVQNDQDAPGRLRMSYEQYLKLEHTGGLTEWVDGEVLFTMPPVDEHQRVVEFLDRLLGLFVTLLKLGLVRVAPFTMRIQPHGPAREPDIFFLAQEHLERLTRQQLNGPADLVVEVVSDESVSRDRTEKFAEYQAGGVREYWIIDPRPGKQRVDCYWLTSAGSYQASLPDEHGRYHAQVLPGFFFHPEWLWAADPPDPLTALAEIRGLTPEAIQAIRNVLRV